MNKKLLTQEQVDTINTILARQQVGALFEVTNGKIELYVGHWRYLEHRDAIRVVVCKNTKHKDGMFYLTDKL